MSPTAVPPRLAALPALALPGDLQVALATSRRSRVRGLAGLAELPRGHALLLPRCRSVHTFGMRFALDLVFLDGHGRPVREAFGVPPRRVRTCLRARAVLETRAGSGADFARVLARETLVF
jgi:uncharacterized membrane protein (UPF0127 family)